MDAQDGGPQHDPPLSPLDASPTDSSTSKAKLSLPLSCDPPGPGNPAKQLVWIVFLPFPFNSMAQHS